MNAPVIPIQVLRDPARTPRKNSGERPVDPQAAADIGDLLAGWPIRLGVLVRVYAQALGGHVTEYIEPEALFGLLADRSPAESEEIPDTGLPPDWERALSAPFVVHDRYGTRCSTLLMVERSGHTTMHERRFDAAGAQTGATRLEFNSMDLPERWFGAEYEPDVVNRVLDEKFDTSPE